MKITLQNGEFATVDDEYSYLGDSKWWKNTWGYAQANKRGKTVRMHREVMGLTDPKIFVDHINGDKLDNRRCNLRTVTPSQNSANSAKHQDGSNRYRGVYVTKSGTWACMVKFGGKLNYMGRYFNEIEAALAYNAAAKEYFGEFAYLNQVDWLDSQGKDNQV